jgi:hypothetical protein
MVMLANGIDTEKERRKWQSGSTDENINNISEEKQASSASDQGIILANGINLKVVSQDNSSTINASPEEIRKARYYSIMKDLLAMVM